MKEYRRAFANITHSPRNIHLMKGASMRRIWLPGIGAMLVLTAAAGAQAPATGVLLNRMSSHYRSMQSYSDLASWKMKAADKEYTADIRLIAVKPNRYLLDIKGDKLNTTVLSDGTILTAIRADRK